MIHVRNPQPTEDDANTYIRFQLKELGWDIRNPAKVDSGEVYKQNECLSNVYIKNCLNLDRPEAIVMLNETDLWIIEAKREKKNINQALDEAKNQYANNINNSDNINCKLISGVAGNDYEGFTVISEYLTDKGWEPVLFNGKQKDILLSKEQALYLIKNQTPNWEEFPDLPESKYLQTADSINKNLHDAGINKNKRARFIAGLILSLSTGNIIDLTVQNTSTLVENVNTLIKQKLKEVDKNNFFDYIKLELPPSETNHIKYRKGIIYTLKELQTLDIQNAMSSGNDVLGKFYEKFLKYGDGAKDIGIVLTPRHITKFAVETLDVKYNDYVLDPTCGTGGFLVSAFDYVKKHSNEIQTNTFKKYNVFGIDQDDDVIALALVNMIFRGDGKNNMEEGNCFQKNIDRYSIDNTVSGQYVTEEKFTPLITKVLMNPPFSLKKGDEKEKNFIDYALSQMQDGGFLFAILPISVMTKRGDKEWRENLLKNNRLMSVVTFPLTLFYPSASVGTVGVYIKKGTPHDYKKDKILFIRAVNDGFEIKKSVRVQSDNIPNDLENVKGLIKSFLQNPNITIENVPEHQKACLIDESDKGLELVPEFYLDSIVPNLEYINSAMEDLIKECACYIIKNS